jgi:hypothetical protein
MSEVAVPVAEPVVNTEKYGDEKISEASAAPAPQMHKVKVNGAEQEVELSKLIERYQKEEAADEKFKSASQLRREAEDMKAQFADIDKNPFEYARKKGIDIHQLAEDILIEKLKWEQSSPEQKELAMERQKRLEYEKRIEELTEKDRHSAAAQAEAKAAKEVDDEIGDALGELGMKPTKAIVANIATTLLSYHEAGRNVTAKEVVKKVRENLQESFKEHISSMSVEDLRAFLPKSHLDGLRKADVQTALAQDPMRSRKKPDATATATRSNKPVSTDDFFKNMDKKFHGR